MSETKKSRALALLVDDEPHYRSDLADRLEHECDIESLEADNSLEALTILEHLAHRVSVVVSDERMPRGLPGGMLLDYIGRRWPHLPRVLLSAWTTGELVATAPYLVLDKALHPDVIAERICELAKAA